MSDSFEKKIYYAAGWDLFYTLDRTATAHDGDRVIVDCGDEGVFMEPYRGQGYYGVVTILDFYLLPYSDQWRGPQTQRA